MQRSTGREITPILYVVFNHLRLLAMSELEEIGFYRVRTFLLRIYKMLFTVNQLLTVTIQCLSGINDHYLCKMAKGNNKE